MTGLCSLMISSTPKLAWKLVSMSSKMAIEPSAPPPLCTSACENRTGKMRPKKRLTQTVR